jgi:hypothetical protein
MRSLGIVVVLLFAVTTAAICQETGGLSIFEISEIKQNGKIITAIQEGRLIDVNSDLLVRLNRSEVDKAFAALANGGGTQEISQTIAYLSELSAAIKKDLPGLMDALKAYKKDSRDENLPTLLKSRSPITESLYRLERIQAVSENFDRRDKQLGKDHLSYEDQVQLYLAATGDALNALSGRLAEIASKEGIYLQAGGWVYTPQGNVAVHLPGFDSISESPPNEIERFRINLSADDKAKLAQYEIVASTVNNAIQNGFSNSDIAAMLKLDDLKDLIAALTEGWKTTDIKALSDIAPSLAKVFDEARGSMARLLSDAKDAGFLFAGKAEGSAFELLTQTDSQILRLARDAEDTYNALIGVKNNLATLDANLLTHAIIVKIKASDFSPLLNRVESLKQLLSNLQAVAGSKTIALDIQDFSEKVGKFTSDRYPLETRLRLITSGRQGAGDRLTLKLALSQKDHGELYAYSWSAILEREMAYITTVPGMALITPYDGISFQAAIAYSILLKGGIQNFFWDTILTPGIGLNVAAPTFNEDRSPGLGLGIGISLFKDIIGAGAGYALWAKNPYLFISLNLPLSIFGLPGANSSASSMAQ